MMETPNGFLHHDLCSQFGDSLPSPSVGRCRRVTPYPNLVYQYCSWVREGSGTNSSGCHTSSKLMFQMSKAWTRCQNLPRRSAVSANKRRNERRRKTRAAASKKHSCTTGEQGRNQTTRGVKIARTSRGSNSKHASSSSTRNLSTSCNEETGGFANCTPL